MNKEKRKGVEGQGTFNAAHEADFARTQTASLTKAQRSVPELLEAMVQSIRLPIDSTCISSFTSNDTQIREIASVSIKDKEDVVTLLSRRMRQNGTRVRHAEFYRWIKCF
jgi:hypothetical protein